MPHKNVLALDSVATIEGSSAVPFCMELSGVRISRCVASVPDLQGSQREPLLPPLSIWPSSSISLSSPVTPILSTDRCGSCGSTGALVMDSHLPYSTSLSNSDKNIDTHARPFCHSHPESADLDDSTLPQYGPDCSSPQDSTEESFQRDQALLADYIRSNSKLSAQLAFMKIQKKKKHTDSNLVRGYRFIVSLHTMLKKMKFKDAPHRHISSKAILACLDVTPSWLSRAKKIVKLLDKLGPEGTLPDPLVIKRLQSKVVTNKGSDLLTFLIQQDSARQNTPTSAVV